MKIPKLSANRVDATSFLSVRELLRRTETVAVLPGLIGRGDALLRPLPVELSRVGHSVGLTVATGRSLSPAGRALLDSLRQVAEQQLTRESLAPG
ncbi:type 2 periplasmic-binding domain-containing protein [Gordonia sp. MP11Mi]|uniref:Uncharacterized protein n=1 Tax=Gordonia sp. MP11Mi TaxID=3022769 RepID=A0AA97CXX7_9ACTN